MFRKLYHGGIRFMKVKNELDVYIWTFSVGLQFSSDEMRSYILISGRSSLSVVSYIGMLYKGMTT